jgi:hypothetical protein
MGPDVLMNSGGGASIIPGCHAATGLGRFGTPARQFLLNRRKWLCCGGVRRRKPSSYKHNAVSLFSHYFYSRRIGLTLAFG